MNDKLAGLVGMIAMKPDAEKPARHHTPAGQATYYREKPCHKCGGHEFYFIGENCAACRRAHSRAYYHRQFTHERAPIRPRVYSENYLEALEAGAMYYTREVPCLICGHSQFYTKLKRCTHCHREAARICAANRRQAKRRY